MKAIVFSEYGSPDVLRLEEVEKPTPKVDEVLVRVHAASVNSWDWELLRGTPFVNRLIFGLLKPKKCLMSIIPVHQRQLFLCILLSASRLVA